MENQNLPNLTLDSTPVMPNLSFSPDLEEIAAPMTSIHKMEETTLTAEELAVVEEFSGKIDLSNSAQMLQYGNVAQKKISQFSETALANVRTKDMDEVGKMITGLVGELKGFSAEDQGKGLFGLFKKQTNHLQRFQTRYTSVAQNVDNIVDVLEGHKLTLLKDVAMLDEMYGMNLSYYKELTLYILAGRKKLEKVLAEDLPQLQQAAKESGKAEDAQTANDLAEHCTRFDKKLHDLELTRHICIQMGPQIRLVQGNDSMMVEKIQSSIVNTIPLWKNQMVLSLGLAHSQQAIEAQREVTNMTNELLRKNADTLKQSTLEAARESERAVVDIETLRHTNESLISTLDEVIQIQQQGREKRRAAEQELQKLESDIKNKLLEIRDTQK